MTCTSVDFGKFKLLGGRTREAHIFIHSGMEEVKAHSQPKSGEKRDPELRIANV